MHAGVRPDDEKAIRALLNEMCDTWARGDGMTYAACFTENSDYVTYNGIRLRGRQENADVHGALFRGVLKGTRISTTIETLEFLADEVALVLTAGKGQKSRQTFVMIRSAGEWKIRSFQNTRLRPLSVWVTRMAMRFGGRSIRDDEAEDRAFR